MKTPTKFFLAAIVIGVSTIIGMSEAIAAERHVPAGRRGAPARSVGGASRLRDSSVLVDFFIAKRLIIKQPGPGTRGC